MITFNIIFDNFFGQIFVCGLLTALVLIIVVLVTKKFETVILVGGVPLSEEVKKCYELEIASTCIFGSLLLNNEFQRCFCLSKMYEWVSSGAFLLFIVLSIILMNWATRKLGLSKMDDIGNIRLMACVYSLVQMIFFNKAIELSTILSFLMLLFGRLIFYDTTWRGENGIYQTIKHIIKYWPLALITAAWNIFLNLVITGFSYSQVDIMRIEAVHIGVLIGIYVGIEVGKDLRDVGVLIVK